MYSFKNDYSEGAHPNIIEALVKSNLEQTSGYGQDAYTEEAVHSIKEIVKDENVDVHLLVGGTQTNLTAISAFLRPHEAVISVETGHVCVHETGAIEATGHKVIAVPSENGKIRAGQILKVLATHTDEHMVKPKLVYISDSTEIGTIYTKAELEAISSVCKANGLYLFLDGARIGSALMCKENDLKMEDFPSLTDAFYIGGTKNGALMGEALVICNPTLKADFRYHIKQKGGLLAKGRLLGIQFAQLFKEDLFFSLATYANEMADLLRAAIKETGYEFFSESPTNQIFVIFPNEILEKLEKDFDFTIWEKIDEKRTAVRLVTSWATTRKGVESFIKALKDA
ncbi:threonine aldolase family protein [Cellulosilyticum ruminicola]|uniref:threonine aldolase family protein n=1 Tax=Cellulosilyticum ruminicola TaxID=425254 RepID=UPI0006D16ACC|nr:low specificity L-threonine aldolase [Cellulosilyticum ruminicola]